MTLSKSDYMLFLKHPAWLWLKTYEKFKLPSIDANLQAMFDTGHDFETYAEQLYPNAVKLGTRSYSDYLALPQKTKEVLDNNTKTIFQGRFEIDNLTCIVDVLDRTSNNSFDLIEIKSSTKTKPEHEYDLAFQTLVLEKSGLTINSISVIHVNNEYVRNGEIEPDKITLKTDVTQNVRDLIPITEQQIEAAFKMLNQETDPDLSPRYVNQLEVPGTNWFTDWMDIYKQLKPNLDPYSIYNLSYPNSEQIGTLEDNGITLIKDIPDELALRPKQLAQIQTTRENTQQINHQKIKEFLDTFEYPLYFLDYETLSSLIPTFDGFMPYKDYPFQYSLHTLEAPGTELRHTEYLHSENSNPMPGLLTQLKKDIGEKGTILTWNMSYEKSCNERLAEFYPEYRDFLEDLNTRINDLMIPFSEMWFVDKNFFGSASIKNVLPALIPGENHKNLDVSDGLLARRLWTETVLEGKNAAKRDKIMADLSEYCTLDTYAMVLILAELKKIIK